MNMNMNININMNMTMNMNMNMNVIAVYVCSNGLQRIDVDKDSLQEDQIFCVLTQDPDKEVSSHWARKDDKVNRVNRVTLMGCGRPGQTKGLTLKVIKRKRTFLLFFLFISIHFLLFVTLFHSLLLSLALFYSHSFS